MSNKYKTKTLICLKKVRFFKFVSLLTRHRVRIFTYHRFGGDHVSSRLFEKQIQYLKKNYTIIDLLAFIELYKEGKILPNSIVLTVDDGYQDFYHVAFPLLKRYSVPATMFLTSIMLITRLIL